MQAREEPAARGLEFELELVREPVRGLEVRRRRFGQVLARVRVPQAASRHGDWIVRQCEEPGRGRRRRA
jgi:hypothetical protein